MVTPGEPVQSRRQRGRPPLAESAETHGRILRVARGAFAELGYGRTTLKEIADRAGLTRPAVNHHFGSKEALYNALFASTRDEVVAVGIANARKQDKLSRQLAAFLEAASQVDSTDRSYAQFMAASILDAFRHPELRVNAQEQLQEVRWFVEQALRSAIESGEIRPDTDIPAVTEMLVAVMWGMGLYTGFVGTHEQLDSVVEQFSRLLEGVLW